MHGSPLQGWYYGLVNTIRFGVACVLLAMVSLAAGGELIPVPNAGFGDAAASWTISESVAMTRVSGDPAIGGSALHVRDDDEKEGSSATSKRISLKGPGKYTLTLQVYPVRGSGLGIYVRLYDAAGKRLEDQEAQETAPSARPGSWQPMSLVFYAGPTATAAEVWFHSYSAAKVEAAVDDLTLRCDPIEARPPWPGTYKIAPKEQERLTAADVVGPDGIVYPDWTYAGVPGGIPAVAVRATIEDFGGKADDGLDDTPALQKACDSLAAKGGGAVLLRQGMYHLDRPILVASDGVVIRGAGQDKTRLVFRYAVAPKTVQFYGATDGQTITPTSWIQAHAHPESLKSLVIRCNGKEIAREAQGQHSGNMFSLNAPTSAMVAGEGSKRVLSAVAEYFDGTQAQTSITVNIGKTAKPEEPRIPRDIGALIFAGVSRLGPQIKLSKDGARGDRDLLLQDASSLRAGERIRLKAPATPRWNALVQNVCKWGDYRRCDYLIESVEGNRVRLNQPLRIEFPTIDGAFVQKVGPIRHCGVEDFTLEQVENLWIDGVLFSEAWECWARGVTIKMAGRNPIYTLDAKWCEIRDCVFDDAHFKGGGGTAYGGYEMTCDSLIDNLTTYNLRHAPLVQWGGSGNVIRNSSFHASDGQWHSGWTNENLFENCVIDVKLGNGAYGYGLWASPPEDEAHGPNGPRNVVYSCDVTSPKSGLWMGGMNENWLILYNRFTVGSGPGVFAKTGSFDHIFRGNHFVLQDGKSPTIRLATPDCTGVELIDNITSGGNGKLAEGAATILRDQANLHHPAGPLPRPTPTVPSIYQWQVESRARTR
jgi:hypothetical protein